MGTDKELDDFELGEHIRTRLESYNFKLSVLDRALLFIMKKREVATFVVFLGMIWWSSVILIFWAGVGEVVGRGILPGKDLFEAQAPALVGASVIAAMILWLVGMTHEGLVYWRPKVSGLLELERHFEFKTRGLLLDYFREGRPQVVSKIAEDDLVSLLLSDPSRDVRNFTLCYIVSAKKRGREKKVWRGFASKA